MSPSKAIGAIVASFIFSFGQPFLEAADIEREPMTMRVVAVNPSAEKTRTIEVRIDLPMEITPEYIISSGDLEVDYDTERSIYYVYKAEVNLEPKQTKVFEVIVEDVWYIEDKDLGVLKKHTNLMMERLKDSEYFEFATELAESIHGRLDGIIAMQSDESIGRKKRIGGYRNNLQVVRVVKEDLSRMEKLLSFTGGPPIPEMLEESVLKSDAPSTTTTWLVIFLVIAFMGLLAGQFFFTWQRKIKTSSSELGEETPMEGASMDGGVSAPDQSGTP